MTFLLLTACATALPSPPLPFHLVEVATVEQPTAIAVPPAGPDGLYVVEQAGRILRIADGTPSPVGGVGGLAPPEDAAAKRPVLDIRDRVVSGGERGLLGLAFAPGYPQDPRVFVNYTYEHDDQLRTRIASYRVSADGTSIDPASEVEVLSFDQPYSNHNSGSLAFGPDGMLYIGVGDGGSGGDPQGHGQNLGDWLGSILRVDVSTPPYTVPADNPFVGKAGALPEIWAYGVRNPWGMHFDGPTLWFADVGQDRWEEVDRGVAGGNYGWNVLEGTHCYARPMCTSDGMVAPVAEYSHDLGQSVTGGFVYRGPSIPAIDGRYVYADFVTGRMWAVPTQGGESVLLGKTDLMPSTFGTDRKGSLYIGDYRGRIWRVEP